MLLTVLKSLYQRSRKSKGRNTTIHDIFAKAKDTPQVLTGLQYFFAKEVNVTDFASSEAEERTLKSAVRTAKETLVHLSSSTTFV